MKQATVILVYRYGGLKRGRVIVSKCWMCRLRRRCSYGAKPRSFGRNVSQGVQIFIWTQVVLGLPISTYDNVDDKSINLKLTIRKKR